MNPLFQSRKSIALFLIALPLAWFAISPTARAVSPAPDGGYPNRNTAEGDDALFSLTTGFGNTAIGFDALYGTNGSYNTANGYRALNHNTTGSGNVALGFRAGGNLTTGSNNIDIGNEGVAGEANTIRIGTRGTQTRTFIVGIYGATAAGGVPVYLESHGQLGTATSSARFKQD